MTPGNESARRHADTHSTSVVHNDQMTEAAKGITIKEHDAQYWKEWMIREMRPSDIEQVMQLWLAGNTEAHSFVPAEYWKSNAPLVQEQLLQSEVYVYEKSGTVLGFVGMQEDYLAGIFVESSARSMGIGKKLLDHIKKIRTVFSLNVYQDNRRAVVFYQREGLTISSKGLETGTGSVEYTMLWRKV